MMALMALAGDLGGSSGPALVGLIAGGSSSGLKSGLLAAAIFPVVMLAGISFIKGKKETI